MGDSEIILEMIAKNNPACPPVFYGTRLMEIYAVSSSDYWFWCPGPLNLADLLTRMGSTWDQIKSDFWLHGSFLPQPKLSWPIKKCVSLPVSDLPSRTINLTVAVPVNPSSDFIVSLLEHNQSLSKVIAALTFIRKSCKTWRQNPNPPLTWSSISSSIIKSFSTAAETLIATNRLKDLVIQPLDVYLVSDPSFRFHFDIYSSLERKKNSRNFPFSSVQTLFLSTSNLEDDNCSDF